MACSECSARSALIAGSASAIERLRPASRQGLLGLLSLSERQLARALSVPAAGSRPSAVAALAGEVCRHEPGYPVALAQLDYAPAVLHCTCDAARLGALLAAPTVAILGESRHTAYAHQVAFALARDLAGAGVTVLSGLHQGIDGIAHHGALHAGGATVAVLGCAPQVAYPRQQEYLHRRVLACGAAVSEFPPWFHPPRRWCLLATQRILGALADVLVVVEAHERSSVLLATHVAAELGVDVAVVPGRVTDPVARGGLELLRDGAHPVGCAQDVLNLIRG